MSRLSICDPDPEPLRREVDGPVLRRNRRRPLHPSHIHDLLRERASRNICARGPTHFGWAIVLWTTTKRRMVRDTHPDATYAEACAIRNAEMAARDDVESAWIKQKANPSDS